MTAYEKMLQQTASAQTRSTTFVSTGQRQMMMKTEVRDKVAMNEVNGFKKLPSLLNRDPNDPQRSLTINTDFMKYKRYARF